MSCLNDGTRGSTRSHIRFDGFSKQNSNPIKPFVAMAPQSESRGVGKRGLIVAAKNFALEEGAITWLQHPSSSPNTPVSGDVMGDFDCAHKFAQRDYVIKAFKGVRAKNPSLTRIIFIDTPKFDATKYFIEKELDPKSLVAVCNDEFQVAPPAGIATINRDMYELEEFEFVNVAVAWIDTCDTNIGHHDWFKNNLNLFAAVPVVMVVNASRGGHFMRHPEDMLPFYIKLHEECARKGKATQVVPYTNKKGSSMIFSYSFLSGFEQPPFKCPSPPAIEDKEETAETGDGKDDGHKAEVGDKEVEDVSVGPPSKRLRSVRTKKLVVKYDDGKLVDHIKNGNKCLKTFSKWKVLY